MSTTKVQTFDEKENWKPIKGYEGLYEISNFGRLKSYKRNKRGRIIDFSKRKIADGHYCRTEIRNSKMEGEHISIHIIVAAYFIENPNNYPIVNHKNGIKTDNVYTNLEWCTYSHNAIHALQTGLKEVLKGERVGGSILKESDVLGIYNMMKTGNFTQIQIANHFNVRDSCIEALAAGRNWKHLGLDFKSLKAKGLTSENSRTAILNQKDVLEIFRLFYVEQMTKSAIGRKIGVSKDIVGHVINRKTWKNVENPYSNTYNR